MIFSDLYKSSRSKLRHSPPQPSLSLPASAYDADLLSRDKAKQKEAVKKFLAEKVRSDWEFTWPPAPSTPAQPETAVLPTGAVVSEAQYAERALVVGAAATASSEALEAPAAPESLPEPTGNPNSKARPLTPPREVHVEDSGVCAPEEPVDSGAEADSETASVYSVMSDDPRQYRPRAEWTSELSDDGGSGPGRGPTISRSPFRFETPDSVGAAVQASLQARKAKRRRAARDEMRWNEGLTCFTARRDAWTGARTVHLKPRPPVSPTSPTSPRRSLWRFRSRDSHTSQTETSPMGATPPSNIHNSISSTIGSPLSPKTSPESQRSAAGVDALTPPASDGDSHTSTKQIKSPTTNPTLEATIPRAAPTPGPDTSPLPPQDAKTYPVETVVPLAPPLIPLANPMRASITPAIYLSIYDKVVSHSLQPSCPINLADMTRSCVAGWKRDGEWPPRPSPAFDFVSSAPPSSTAAVVAVRARRRRDRQEEKERAAAAAAREKERRGSAATMGSSGGGGNGRRMSLAGLISRGGLGGGGEERDKDKAEAAVEDGSPKGIRRSLQRVLGLGGHGHGHGHGHSTSVGSVGQTPNGTGPAQV